MGKSYDYRTANRITNHRTCGTCRWHSDELPEGVQRKWPGDFYCTHPKDREHSGPTVHRGGGGWCSCHEWADDLLGLSNTGLFDYERERLEKLKHEQMRMEV